MKKIITRRRFNIVSMFTIVVLLANLLIVNFINKSYANKIPEKFDLRSEVGTIIGNESQNKNKPQGSLKNAELIQLESHIKLGKKNGKYSSYTDEVLSNLSSIESELNYKVKAIFPLYKETTPNGVKYYTDTEGKEATTDELTERRESLKQTIITYGGVITYISNNGIKDGLNGSGKVCLCKDLITAAGNQAVVIIGWDDNFSKDNFPESCRPTSNGAFIVQSFDDVFYVSYEDIYVENSLRYIDSVDEYKSSENEENKDKEDFPEEPAVPEELDDPAKPEEQAESDEQIINPEKQAEEQGTTTPEKQEDTAKIDEQNKQEEPSGVDEPQETQEPSIPEEQIDNQEETSVDNQTPETNTEQENTEGNIEQKAEDKTIENEEEKDVTVDPGVPTEVTKVETGNNDTLEVDTSSIKDTPVESSKSTIQTSKTNTNSTNINSSTNTTESEYVSNANMAKNKLPQTGSNAEIYLVIAIAAVMFIAFIVHSLRNVIGSGKE